MTQGRNVRISTDAPVPASYRGRTGVVVGTRRVRLNGQRSTIHDIVVRGRSSPLAVEAAFVTAE